MGITRFFLFFTFLVASWILQGQSAYVRHTVQEGETIYTIARHYHITAVELIRFNPDAESGMSEGDILIIPQADSQLTEDSQEIVAHTVQPKETLYGLSKKYNCSVHEIIALNPEVRGGLKIGMVIKVPKNPVESKAERDTVNYFYHTVEEKETVYSICRTAGISEEEFLELNPIVKQNGLQIGQEIKLPKSKIKEEVPVDQKPKEKHKERTNKKPYDLYRIKPGDNVGIIARKFKCSDEDIIKLNPELVRGVIPGRYIVVPVIEDEAYVPTGAREQFDRFWKLPSIYEKPKIKLAVLVPLFLDENDSVEISAFNDNGTPIAKRSEFGLQYLAGVRTALDTLVALGYQVELEVYDTENDLEQIKQIAREISPEIQLVLGPLYSKNASYLAELLPSRTIISPMSKSLDNTNKPNLVDCINYQSLELDGISQVLNGCLDTTDILFVNLDTNQNYINIERIATNLRAVDSNKVNYLWVDQSFSQLNDLDFYLNDSTKHVVVLIDQNAAFLSDFIRKFSKRNDSSTLVIGTSKLFDIPTLEKRYLNDLNYIAVRSEYIDWSDTCTHYFVKQFRENTNTEPNRFGFSGYDTALFFAQLLADYGTIPESENWPVWRGLQKGFQFEEYTGSGPKNSYFYKTTIQDYQMVIREK